MRTFYQQVISPLSIVQEDKKTYFPLTERHLQVLWLEQKFFSSLMTVQGEPIEVLSPGIWNTEAGPDFLKAHLRIGRHIYRGDVEIHLHDAGWYQHGHHQDPRYNQVILHVSYWPVVRPSLINTERGEQSFSCYLEGCLTVPLVRLTELIDFDLYPSKQFVGSGRCSGLLFSQLSDEQTNRLLQSAAYWRLERKLNFLEQHVKGRAWQFAAGIAMALGYKHNALAFLELFIYLLDFRDMPYEELLAIALGCCGFLEEGRKQNWGSSSYYQKLRFLWWGRRDQITHQAHLKLDRIRPLHHPVRRLVYLTYLLQDSQLETLWFLALDLWKQFQKDPQQNFRKLKVQFLQILPLYPDSYWDYHFTFEEKAQRKILPSLGEDLKVHMLLNTYLPLLYATLREAGESLEWERFQRFYASLEVAFTSKSRYLHRRFFGEQQASDFLTQAQRMQGAYQLHHDFCVHFEASCEGCPFVARYQALIR
jgi:hypothetical protein